MWMENQPNIQIIQMNSFFQFWYSGAGFLISAIISTIGVFGFYAYKQWTDNIRYGKEAELAFLCVIMSVIIPFLLWGFGWIFLGLGLMFAIVYGLGKFIQNRGIKYRENKLIKQQTLQKLMEYPQFQKEVASHNLLSFEDRCRAWLEKQPNWEAKVELGKLLMIPLMELSSAQLARLEELREVLKDH